MGEPVALSLGAMEFKSLTDIIRLTLSSEQRKRATAACVRSLVKQADGHFKRLASAALASAMWSREDGAQEEEVDLSLIHI